MLSSSKHSFTNRERDAPKRHIRELQDDVILFLRDNRGPQSFRKIKAATTIDLARSKKLLENLCAHERVARDQQALYYNPVLPNISNVEDLRAYISRTKLGSAFSHLSDAYVGVKDDLEKLKNEDFVITIANPDSKDVMFYPRIASLEVQVDEAVKELWRAVSMPDNDVEIERELYDAGLLSGDELESGHQRSKRRKRPAKRVKKTRAAGNDGKRRRYRLTNVHMVDQYQWLKDNSK